MFLHTVKFILWSDFIQLIFASTSWFFFPPLPSLRSSRSLRTWSLGSCPRSSRRSQTRCVASCSVCLPSARTEPCRYLQWNTHTRNGLALLVRPWLISGPSHSSGGIHCCFFPTADCQRLFHFNLRLLLSLYIPPSPPSPNPPSPPVSSSGSTWTLRPERCHSHILKHWKQVSAAHVNRHQRRWELAGCACPVIYGGECHKHKS